ncbi:phosphoribosylanthranilate isomerase [Pseudohoeflea coraliihabitans]|uniref:N-(5'-phosphoribosyl)anthranilate isomerase n=1 Tax=Pseudohoeflea coraliihabitans TaxID=2860393 RepID=A0ABS6WT16_9HYPH|nr:phosphoribosylanthranilate isomerase [Pseudohoeflea sp. DP4N28-3]MBW3099094.1 phosphoribosylanthranilate isomerase [Pseudohoeflea sp. DP4N28-3]
MSTHIKFCGLKTVEAVEQAAALGAWKAGFIFFAKSPRNVTVEHAGMLAARAHALGLATVAVTVNASDAELDAIIDGVRPTLLQFHGAESPAQISKIKARSGLKAMKAIPVRTAEDLAAMEPFLGVADHILFDAKAPRGSALPGGNGVQFDWTLLDSLDRQTDYVLSGGLDAANVGVALRTTGCRFLDVSSGIESAPGIKDLDKMRAFAEAVRRHDSEAVNSTDSAIGTAKSKEPIS